MFFHYLESHELPKTTFRTQTGPTVILFLGSLALTMSGNNDSPEALWYWKTDQGNWHLYPKGLHAKLEDAWKNGVTRFPVDAERFVNTVKMEQRRLDMTGKVRQVQRVPVLPLEAYTFALTGKFTQDPIPLISKHGGVATHFITEKVRIILFPKFTLNELLTDVITQKR